MSLIPSFDTSGSYPAVYTSNIIDVSKYSHIHIQAFYNANATHTINWYTTPSIVATTTPIAVTAGGTVNRTIPVYGKYMSITYNSTVAPFVMRTQHIFYG